MNISPNPANYTSKKGILFGGVGHFGCHMDAKSPTMALVSVGFTSILEMVEKNFCSNVLLSCFSRFSMYKWRICNYMTCDEDHDW